MLFLGLAKSFLRIGSPIFPMIVMAVGVVLLFVKRLARIGRWWLTVWTVALLFFATPIGARMMTWPLAHGYRPLQSKEQARGVDVIVMMGGGIHSYVAAGLAVDDLNSSALRVLETARLYRLLDPRKVIVSGGNTGGVTPPRPEARSFQETLVGLGVPRDRIVIEDRSWNTREEVVILRPMLESLGAKTFVLVTSPSHMYRSMRAFQAEGLMPIASPSRLFPDERQGISLVPTRDALLVSDGAVYESVARVYYWMRGWI